MFESQSGALPAIGSDLQLNGASGNPADFSAEAYFAGGAGIAASIAGAMPGSRGAQRGVVGGLRGVLDAAVGLPDSDLELPARPTAA